MTSILLDLPIHRLERQSSLASVYGTGNGSLGRIHSYSTSHLSTHLQHDPSSIMHLYMPHHHHADHSTTADTSASVSHDAQMYHNTQYQLQTFHIQQQHDMSLDRLPSFELHPRSTPPVHPLAPSSTGTAADTTSSSSTSPTAAPAPAPAPRSRARGSTSSRRRGSNSTAASRDMDEDDDDMSSVPSSAPPSRHSSKRSASSASMMDDGAPYHRNEYRKIRHRQTDTNRRVRIKTLIEELRCAMYVNKSAKVEQSQIIQDALNYIAALREENASLQQRVEQLEQAHPFAPPSPSVSASHTRASTATESDAESHHHKEEALNVATGQGDEQELHLDTGVMDATALVASKSNRDMVTIAHIPESLRNTNIAVWATSLDGCWLDFNLVFELTTSYKASDLVHRHVAEHPTYATAVLTEDDPYNDNNDIASLALTRRESAQPLLGQGSTLYTDPAVARRAIDTPLLFNTTWLDAVGVRRRTRFMAQVLKDDKGRPSYILHMYYRCI